jgi:hypothetical protein
LHLSACYFASLGLKSRQPSSRQYGHVRHMPDACHFTILTNHKAKKFTFQHVRQMFVKARQTPRYHLSVHDGHSSHIRPGQHCRQRAFPHRRNHPHP